MNAQDLLTKPIDAIDFDERMRLIVQLIEKTPIKSVRPSAQCCMMLFSADDVPPMRPIDIRERNYCLFKIADLYIVNTIREIEDVAVTEKTGIDKRTRKTVHSRRIIDSPAAAWSIHQMFVGNYNACPVAMNSGVGIPAAGFTLKSPLTHKIVEPGVDVAIRVMHNLTTPANFRALLFGIPQK